MIICFKLSLTLNKDKGPPHDDMTASCMGPKMNKFLSAVGVEFGTCLSEQVHIALTRQSPRLDSLAIVINLVSIYKFGLICLSDCYITKRGG